MGAWLAPILGKGPTPVEGMQQRVKNIIKNNFRGLIGTLGIVIFGGVTVKEKDVWTKTQFVWFSLIWASFWQPVNIGAVGLLPVFFCPLLGLMKSDLVCSSYFNNYIAMYIISGYVLMVFNVCKFDRRVILRIIDGPVPASGPILIVKCCLAAFIMSMLSNRLLVTEFLIETITPILEALEVPNAITVAKKKLLGGNEKEDICYVKYRIIICSAIQTSSSIGSLVFIHASPTVLAGLALWSTYDTYENVFNYAQYTAFALPTCIVLLIFNTLYYILVFTYINRKRQMTESGKDQIHKALKSKADSLSPMGLHEGLAIFFYLVTHLLLFSRFSTWFTGWSTKLQTSSNYPIILDTVVFAGMSFVMHIIPRSTKFLKIFTAKKKSEVTPLKMESTVLFWKFVDKHTYYSYIFLIGGGCALIYTITDNALNIYARSFIGLGKQIEQGTPLVGILIVVIITAILSNLITAIAAEIVFMPIVVNLMIKQFHLMFLGCAMGASFGFMAPFLNTPAYFCKALAKISFKRMIQYNLGSTVICSLILWVMLAFYGNTIWPKGPASYQEEKGAETTAAGAF